MSGRDVAGRALPLSRLARGLERRFEPSGPGRVPFQIGRCFAANCFRAEARTARRGPRYGFLDGLWCFRRLVRRR